MHTYLPSEICSTLPHALIERVSGAVHAACAVLNLYVCVYVCTYVKRHFVRCLCSMHGTQLVCMYVCKKAFLLRTYIHTHFHTWAASNKIFHTSALYMFIHIHTYTYSYLGRLKQNLPDQLLADIRQSAFYSRMYAVYVAVAFM